MKTYNSTYLIDLEEDVVFKAEYDKLEEKDGGLFCSLRGEFFKKDRPYEPPMRYEMHDTAVTSQNLAQILNPIYYSLLLEREGNF